METYHRYIVFLICLICSFSVFSQATFSISGSVNDANSQEILSKVRVTIWELQVGTYTDARGNFSLDVPPGDYTFGFTHTSYQKHFLKVSIAEDSYLPVNLLPKESARTFSIFGAGSANQSGVSAPVRLINDLEEIFFHKIWK